MLCEESNIYNYFSLKSFTNQNYFDVRLKETKYDMIAKLRKLL